MKLIGKISLAAVLAVGLFQPAAHAEGSGLEAKCKVFGALKPGVNPSYQQMNCLLTNAALNANIPPEVVKAVASKESGWKQFDAYGGPYLSTFSDGGVGIMQVTNHPEYDQESLESSLIYNIEKGVEILSDIYDTNNLPKIKGADRNVIENWYFPVMAYNGTKPVNSPLYQATGKRNASAYQEKVYEKIVNDSFQKSIRLAQFPFKTADFDYDKASDENIKFTKKEYIIPKEQLHSSAYLFTKGSKVMVTGQKVNIQKQPSTGKNPGTAVKNDVLVIKGPFVYDKNSSIPNQFVWYPVETIDHKTKGYISSAYITKLVDKVKPIISGAAPKTIKYKSSFYTKAGITAWDNADGNITSRIHVNGSVNTKKRSTYTLTYKVTDKAGHTTTASRKITVK